jgi:peptidylprolyl isomerase
VEDAIITVPRSELPPNITPAIGMQLQLMTEDNQIAVAVIKAVTETEVTLDGNHPLAGKDLTFELELVEIK